MYWSGLTPDYQSQVGTYMTPVKAFILVYDNFIVNCIDANSISIRPSSFQLEISYELHVVTHV